MLISEKCMYFCKHEDTNLAHECTSHSKLAKKDADRNANSGDHDHTAPLGTV